MADLSEADKKALYGPNWRTIDAQIQADSARSRGKWRLLMPVAVAAIAVVSLLVVAAEAFF
ncbi:MAG: hypothetical protein K2Y29_21120 [Beijerinckiaceae bacterium]|nr:hypothetical protein [Beijerinckiaceae bacterium]